eukprot:TRINITY_DN856_c0_g1_i2.p2 TRINITY_DN856_c0_g1~~TRINITY_DN856_c0_g1_i2.p2  ORF type:complete len:195 (-),score=31.87 TRINITY_DN856_c0_g1_i2:2-586(-)
MDEWTKCQGYPYLQISRKSATIFIVEQHRFLSSGPADAKEDTTIWTIPVEIRVQGREETIRMLIKKRTQEIELPGVDKDAWVKFNTGYKGFYVCKYDSLMTAQLSKDITSLSTLDRFSLIKDYSMLMKGFLSASSVLELISGYKDEADFTVWDTIDSSLTQIEHIIQGQPHIPKKKKVTELRGRSSETAKAHRG